LNLYDQKENGKLILLFLLFIGEHLDIEYISKKVYICAYLSIDKTDKYSWVIECIYTSVSQP